VLHDKDLIKLYIMPLHLFPEESETIVGAAKALRAGACTCLQLVERCLRQIDAWEPRVHAWVSVDSEGAKRRARQLDDELAAGRDCGPLHGIPIGIKDIIDMAGLPTGAGSEWMAASIAAEDATVVTKLRDAGAVLLGKTVTTHLASFDPPPTRNPWNLEHTPGGSSSGSAAAVATGMCLGAVGSQTGGSITRPAAYCGVAGCKPTHGRISLAGVVPLAPSLDHPGPIARCVTDLALLYRALADYDRSDQFFDTNSALRPPRIGRLRSFFDGAADADSLSVFESSLDQLRAAGASMTETSLPTGFDEVHRQHGIIMRFEFARHHGQRWRDDPNDFLPFATRLIREGCSIDEHEYAAALQSQAKSRQESPRIFAACDIAVCLAAPGAAPDPSTTGDPVFNSPWSYAGLPTVSFPIGLSRNNLPVAIQLVAPAFAEESLFSAAQWCETVLRTAIGN
jgi:aspartyl-tRNA(Asn)/glutamyl-tRNA(Gln) amidotransferase subunit A